MNPQPASIGREVDPASVFIVVPSYNEGKVVRNTLMPLLMAGYSVVLVDDCSTDQTKQAVADLGIHYLRHPINLGQGAALQTGMTYALQQGADYIVHFDADGQHNFRDIDSLLAPILAGEADVTTGTRFQRKEDIRAVPASRRVLLKAAVLVNGLLTGMWMTDAHNGFRAFSRSAAQAIRITENRMAHATEILSLIRQAHLRLTEVPVHITYSEYSWAKGQSSLNSFHILIDLILRKIL
ncbi:glycosyltransferase family 2 protein [Spirosoma taeanense]|uniref:Glycosyltransferase family 2 protein n=1 Tax=Spirosoma taeanense TaxID=2735870 RepID=A0A6M5YEK2_9BACT|nr:glycosyltransferase family 2 protein [Spirosoma taeanense]QJW91713.1 glycosyltransferase family 2 protein [Spirosoma taeanense]